MQRDIFLLNRRTDKLRLSRVIGCTDIGMQNITSDSVIPSSLSETKAGRKLEQLFQLRIFAVGGGVSDNTFIYEYFIVIKWKN